MKKILLLLIFTSTFAIGQTLGNGDGITTDTQAGIVIREVPIEGSRYMNDIYKQGETIINGRTQTTALMRYDAYNDAVEILDKSQQARKLLRRKSIVAKFGGKTYIVIDYKAGNKTKLGYFNPLNEGETVIYFKPKKVFVQAEKPEDGYDTYDPPIYRDVSEYYIKKGKAPAQLVKLGKRSILKQLGGKTAELKKFISENKLNLNKETDVVKLVVFYNTIHKTAEKSHFNGPTGIGA